MKKQKKLNTKIPNPGGREAQALGCTCPVMDNNYGKGYYMDGKIFVYNMKCKLHNKKPLTSDKKRV